MGQKEYRIYEKVKVRNNIAITTVLMFIYSFVC